ncbi:hypothetical protein HWD97_16915 [Ochrobactrum sp. C6C9]|uniref:hypothetical protein n=1 Tax=Ochrobactrum sp. C6C9 TaxID=2736662 RepID=UPI0035302FE3|nr:hypothetical protein [Ochrobactrum sp. C6C9]
MTKRAAIMQADLRRMAVIAKEEGVTIEAEIGGAIYRVSPAVDVHNLIPRRDKPTVRL